MLHGIYTLIAARQSGQIGRRRPAATCARPGGIGPAAWARKDFVSHDVYDHTSILKLVETKWNLPALTHRDANAAPMLDLLDLRRPSFATPPKLAPPLAVTDPSALTCSVNGPGTIPPAGSVTG